MSFITYLVIELICAIFIYTQYIPAQPPSFSSNLFSEVIVSDVSPYWGRWHHSKTITYKSTCFDITETCNSYGARDIERQKNADTNRVVLLGDSFIEGYGLKNDDRLSNLLEKTTQKEVLNFGCTGIGHSQYAMIYKHLAADFSHNIVMVGILPANDFFDSDKTVQEQLFMDYRPYWKTDYPDCEMMYWTDKIENSPYYYKNIEKKSKKLFKIFRNYTYWYNVLYYAIFTKNMMQIMNHGDLQATKSYSGFYDYTPTQLSHLKCSLSSIKTTAQNKKVLVFTIPKYTDIERYQKEQKTSKLGQELANFCTTQNIIFVDLLPLIAEKYPTPATTFYHSCDDHFSRLGNEWATSVLTPYIK